MSGKGTYHHGNLREALLAAAFSVLVESGVEGLSLRGVARRAGVSPGAPYNHFKDKQAILSELARSRRARAGHVIASATENAKTPPAKLRALGTAYVEHALGHQAEFKLMFDGSLAPYLEGQLGDVPMLGAFRTVILEANDQLSAAELDVTAVTAWSLVHGLAQLLISGPLQALNRDPEQVGLLVEQVTIKLERLLK